ncbi:DUF99 family protein [Candidatus Thorarchaeota archaeon]|nr:MAG: DUF99 family protein [Candidatus Thorarchaeota archaeon]
MGIAHKIKATNQIIYENPQQWKTGTRVLGISESFTKDVSRSIVVGVVMRGDFRIDGFSYCRPSIGGIDATRSLLHLYEKLGREDIRAWMLGGNIISWFNVVDISELYHSTDIPVVSVTFNPSDGIEKYLQEYFPDSWRERAEMIDRTGKRQEIVLATGYRVYLSIAGLSLLRAKQLIDMFTIDGRVPEPIRVSRIIASGLFKDRRNYNTQDVNS